VKEIQGKKGNNKEVAVFEDYQKVLENPEIDIVTIVTTDHWHTKIAIEAMKAGKDVYCEKPLTLTIDEGKQIIKVLKETGRVFQVGTQQRSEMNQRFLNALAIIKEGRLGDITEVECVIGGIDPSGSIPVAEVPKTLNWDKWLGQAPMTDYRWKSADGRPKTRCHYEFRWWYEYSGGKMTDWGAHHVDIAQWGIGMDHSGPTQVVPISAVHPVPLKDGMPTKDDEYNVASRFEVQATFPNDVKMTIKSDGRNGILFSGTKGRMFVSRGDLTGKPVEDLKDNPLSSDTIKELYKGRQPGDHMRNFYECVDAREQPISDVMTHHRAITTCHLANIAIRLNRSLKWDPQTEQIIGDDEANQLQIREQRKGYEINA
ncbi:MAG: Gfo/Idh/MocA family oxidoreductase, partial [Gimesia chilikensis]